MPIGKGKGRPGTHRRSEPHEMFLTVTEMAEALGFDRVALATAIDNCPARLLSQYLTTLDADARAAQHPSATPDH